MFKYGSVASFVCVTALTVIEGVKAKSLASPQDWIVCLMLFFIFCLTWFMHRSNIERLLCGRESKVSLLKSIQKQINKRKRANAIVKARKKEQEKKQEVIKNSETEISEQNNTTFHG